MAQDEDVVISSTAWVAELNPVELFPPYKGYQKQANRDIPVIRLCRVAD
ncbi:hypothetical protein [Streptomyces odonnellii]|nr:hypothetical protein [Streptomyces odonnellii]